MNNINWSKLVSTITGALTLLVMIPYDKETMDLAGQILPVTWTPWIIKIGIAATLGLRLRAWWNDHGQAVTLKWHRKG